MNDSKKLGNSLSMLKNSIVPIGGIGTTVPVGILDVRGGTAAAATNGTSINLLAQNAGAGNQNGGDINLTPGSKAGTGSRGQVNVVGRVSVSQTDTSSGTDGLIISKTNLGSTGTSNGITISESSLVGTNALNGLLVQTADGSTSATTSDVAGVNAQTSVTGFLATPTNVSAILGSVINTGFSSTITNAYGVNVKVLTNQTITNTSGVYTGTVSGTNKWSFYASDATAPNYFAGNVGIGTSAPSTPLHVKGQILGGYVSGSSSTISWLAGNVQKTSVAAPTTLNFTSGTMFDGGNYTLVLTGAAGTYTLGVAGDITTWKCSPACASSQITTSGETVLKIIKVGSTGYVSWVTGF